MPIHFLLSTLLLGLLPVLGIPAIFLARRRWKKEIACYLATSAQCGLTGEAVARRLLDVAGLSQITVVSGGKRDLFDRSKRRIQLHDSTFTNATVPALAVAAHEVGHAAQFAARYLPARLRRAFGPLVLAGVVAAALAAWPCTVLPKELVVQAVFAFLPALVLVILPAVLASEYDATRRARDLLRRTQLATPGELQGCDRVLKAGFQTYLANSFCLTMLCGAFLLPILPGLFGAVQNSLDAIRNSQVPSANTRNSNSIENHAPPHAMPEDEGLQFDLSGILVSLLTSSSAVISSAAVLLALSLLLRRKKPSQTTKLAVERNEAAVAITRTGNWNAAIAEYTEAIRLQPKLVVAYVSRGNCLTQLRRFDEALADLNAAIRIQPGVAAFLSSRATIHLHRGDFDRALIDCNEALRLTPESTDALCCRSVVRLRMGQFQKAIDDANQALQSDPNSFIAFNNRGVSLLKIGDYRQAEADLREAIRTKPEFPNAYKHLAWLQATCPQAEFRDGAQAVTNATHALELAAWKPVDWLAALAAAHAETGNFDEAVKWQIKCLDESPETEKPELRRQLESYQLHKPFRDPPQDSAVIAEAQVVDD